MGPERLLDLPLPSVCKSLVFASILILHGILTIAQAQLVSECGTIDEAIAERDLRAQVPWTVALYFQSTLCDYRPAGEGHGILIGPSTVLLKGKFMWSDDGYGGIRMDSYSPHHFIIIAGLKSKIPFVADQHTQFLKIASIQPHYLSYETYSEYDYAIVHLKNRIQFTSFVRPICLDTLPPGIFERSNSTVVNDHLIISGFRTGSGSYRSALHADKEPFGFLSPELCTSELQGSLSKSAPAGPLIKTGTPCGVSTKAVEDLVDIRLLVGSGGTGSSRGDISLGYLKQLLNITKFETPKGNKPISNTCFHNGASVATLYQGKWHLVGITTESLGVSCDKNIYFVSFVASRNNLNWILQHLRFSPSSFICSNGQAINIENTVCDGQGDCADGSDEDEKLCTCTPKCDATPHCLLQPMCRHCVPSDTLKILPNQKYKFSTTESQTKSCPPVKPLKGTTVYCKAPGLKSVPCDRQHFSGSQAVFSCSYFDRNTPATYAVITCQDTGFWTNELSTFRCEPLLTSVHAQEEDNILIAERRNLSTSSNFSSTSNPVTTTTVQPITFHMKHKDKNGTIMCPPVDASDGTQVSCWTTTSAKRIACSDPMYTGSSVEYTCSNYYKPLLSTASVVKHCQPDGEWSLSNRNFECRLDCGIPKPELIGHIVNGRETEGAKWPWHGLIFINVGDLNFTYICGSTLISKRILITAAHCVTDRQGAARNASLYKVVLAATSNVYHKNILDQEIQIFYVTNVVVHPHFNLANFEADIAILQLSRPIAVSDYVRPACIPSTLGAHTELKHLSPGSLGTVVGFGYDETGNPSKTLKEASLPVVSYKDCFDVSKIQHSSTQYCAGYTNGTSVCNGDSGSGQFFEEEFPQKRMYLQGIVSHGNRNESSRLCDNNQYSVFTKIASFKTWISETALELDDDF